VKNHKESAWLKVIKIILFSVLPLALSAFAIVTTCHFNEEQNIKWEALNRPRITPTNITLVAFEELDTSVAVKRTWGYPTLYSPVIKDGVYTGRSRVYAELVFWDANQGERKWGNRIMTTLEDVKEETKRLHVQQNITLQKHCVFLFSFRNSGQLSAHDIKIHVQLIDDAGKKEFQLNPISELAGGETKDISLHNYMDINLILGKTEHFIITTRYEYAGKIYTSTRKLAYDMFGNAWGFE
jgi:hypothetical protein